MSSETSSNNTMIFGANGISAYSTMGKDIESKLLELDQSLIRSVGTKTPLKDGKFHKFKPSTTCINAYACCKIDEILTELENMEDNETKKKYKIIIFRYLAYLRNIRGIGKREKLFFYELFLRLNQKYPQTCINFLPLVPIFGYFQDYNNLLNKLCGQEDEPITKEIVKNFAYYIKQDVLQVYKRDIRLVTYEDAKELNNTLKTKSTNEIKEMMKGLSVSLASKWFTRECKQENKKILVLFLEEFFGYDKQQLAFYKTFNYLMMRLRNIISSLTQCLLVGEQMMCYNPSQSRDWDDIPIENAPATFLTKYRKALLNEKLDEPCENEQGNRSILLDRIACRNNVLNAVREKKIHGQNSDIEKLAKIIFNDVNGSSQLSNAERELINEQWKDLVSKEKKEIDDFVQENKNADNFIDPRNVIPVVDTSGSMCGANVQDIAIALGLLSTAISTMPGCMIAFSERSELFNVDVSSSIFEQFKVVMNGPMGYSTNIESVYDRIFELLDNAGNKSVDFAILQITDSQYNTLSSVREEEFPDFYRNCKERFTSKGYNMPRHIFWNLNSTYKNYVTQSNEIGVMMINGFSQTLLRTVLTGEIKIVINPNTGEAEINTTPWDTLEKSLFNSVFDCVDSCVDDVN